MDSILDSRFSTGVTFPACPLDHRNKLKKIVTRS